MSWTAAELLAMQEADKSIENTFEKYEAYTREQLLLDRWLDKIALLQQGLYQFNRQPKSISRSKNYYLSQKAARIAYQRRYRQKNKEIIALKKKAFRRAKRRQKNESVESH